MRAFEASTRSRRCCGNEGSAHFSSFTSPLPEREEEMPFIASSGLTEAGTSKTIAAGGMNVHYHDVGEGEPVHPKAADPEIGLSLLDQALQVGEETERARFRSRAPP